MIAEQKLREIADSLELSIETASRYGNKKNAEELKRAQLVLNRLSTHISNINFGLFNAADFAKHIEDALQCTE